MRQLPDWFDSRIAEVLDEAKAKLAAGDPSAALALYTAAWETTIRHDDHAHACVIAHMAGVAEPDPRKKLQWNLDALREADEAGAHLLVGSFYPSLHNNLALSYLAIGDRAAALRHLELAAARLDDIEPGPYGERVRSVVGAQLAKLRAEG